MFKPPYSYAWATLLFMGVAGMFARAVDANDGFYNEVVAAWVQAIGATAAILVAIALPRVDRARARREFGEAAMAAAGEAHRQIAAVWGIANNLPGFPTAKLEDCLEGLRRAADELDSFPLLRSESLPAVVYMRHLAECARGCCVAIEQRQLGKLEVALRSHRIANYAHHLLVLIARAAGQPEPPPPFDTDGVPASIVAAVQRRSRA